MPLTTHASAHRSDGVERTKLRSGRLTAKGERTRSAILEAAERQFSERGYDGVSLRQILEESGVKMGQLQYYFPSKEHVFSSVIESRIEGVVEGYSAALLDLERQAACGTLELRMLVRSVMAVSREWLTSDDVGKHRYLKVLGLSTLGFNQANYVARHTTAFKPLNDIVVGWLRRLYPQLAEERLVTIYYLIELNLISLYASVDTTFLRSGRPRTGKTVHRLYDDWETFLVGGIERLLDQP